MKSITDEKIKDLFEKMTAGMTVTEVGSKSSEKELPITRREAISIAKYLYGIGHEPVEIHSKLSDSETRKKVLEKIPVDIKTFADDVINAWSSKLFFSKMSNRPMSKWRRGLSHFLASPDSPIVYTDLSLAVSLPRYHEYQERYAKLANEYVVDTSHVGRMDKCTIDVEFIDTWEERNSAKGRQQIFAFKAKEDNRLILITFRIADPASSVMLMKQLLNFTKQFKLTGYPYSKIINEDKYAWQFDASCEIEALNEK